tara:strand:+ start:1616 stop:4351 length:2736 start_codon:yes stop_codon:yes gene_type:complete
MKKRLFLLDGMALIYRAYFAFIRNPRITSKGNDVSAIFGFLNTFLEILKKYNPSHIAVVLDSSGPTFRHEYYPEYKANRDETPDGIRYSIPIIKDLLDGFNIAVIEKKGFEADDIIGTLAKNAEKESFETFMVTPDKDYAQLVDDNTFILKPARGGNDEEILDKESILSQWNIKSIDHVIDILGLAGDSVDNIPGVPGIGPKTAQKLIFEFGSIENVIKNSNKLKGKQKENIEIYRDNALLSKKLATIKCDVPIDCSLDSLIKKELNREKVITLLKELEFRSFIKRLFEKNEELFDTENFNNKIIENNYDSINTVSHNYQTITNINDTNALIKKLETSNIFSFDLETTSLEIQTTQIIGISISIKSHEAYYIALPKKNSEKKQILNLFNDIFVNENINKIGQNLKFDLGVLLAHGYKIKGKLIDTMIAHYLIDPSQRHNMDYIAKTELNYSPIPLTNLIGEKRSNQINMEDVPIDKLAEYAAEDADITFQLWGILSKKLKDRNLEKVFYDIEMPLLPVLVQMENTGINININFLKKYSLILEKQINQLEKSIYTLSGMAFNINSPKQLGEVLFDLLKIIENPKKTKTGQYQTGEEILSDLANDHKIVNKIIQYRQLMKLKTTYVDALPDNVCLKTQRIHTTFSQSITTTGRLSSSNPNLQNIPIKTDAGREIRRSFIPSDGYKLLACDYSQIELRVLAELSNDKNLKNAFLSGEDIHSSTASLIFKVNLNQVTREMRNKAKMTNFGIIYGISAFGLSKRLGISRTEASSIIKQYKMTYPGIEDYLNDTISFAQKNEYVETITGRRRYIRDINAKNKMVRSGAQRNAINAPIQGTAADMIKIAMTNIQNELINKNFKTEMLLQVHDELVFNLHFSEKEILLPIIENYMKTAISMKTPILIESGIGDNWIEAH